MLVHCHAGCSQDAVIAALRSRGFWPEADHEKPTPRRVNGAHSATQPPNDWRSMAPPPLDAPKPTDSQLQCDMLHEYRDADDRLLLYVRRHEARAGRRKQFYPLTYGILNGECGWHDKAPNNPKPLFGLNRLSHVAQDATVLLCEGEKSADAAQRMFRDHVALSWMGGAQADKDADLSPLAGLRIIIWPDADKGGRDAAIRLALRLPGARIVDTEGLPNRYDAANLEESGADPKAWLAERLPPERPPSRGAIFGQLTVYSMDDLDTSPSRSYLVKGLIALNEISLWCGPPKSGKSFLLMGVCYKLSLGLPVFGRRVRQAKVLYVAAEGEGGIGNRLKALRRKFGPSANFHWIAQPADLLHGEGHLDDLVKAAQAYGAQVIVLDTLNRLLAGGDENSPQDMGTFVRNVAELRYATGAHVAIVHHGTKASYGVSPRGHGSLIGAEDAMISVVKDEAGNRTATIVHAKDDADGDRMAFPLAYWWFEIRINAISL